MRADKVVTCISKANFYQISVQKHSGLLEENETFSECYYHAKLLLLQLTIFILCFLGFSGQKKTETLYLNIKKVAVSFSSD